MKQPLLSLVLLLISACVSTNDFNRVQGDVYELRKEIVSLKERTSGVVKEDSFSTVKESQADMLTRINETSSGLQDLRGRFEENRFFTEKTLKDVTAEKDLLRAQVAGLESQVKAMKDRLAALEQQEKTKEPSEEHSQTPQQNAGQQGTDAGLQEKAAEKSDVGEDSKTRAYDVAYQAFIDKKYKEARAKFEAFSKEYPKSDLTDNAQFWIAESYFAENDFENAILSYETLVKKYPDSDKASAALLKQGTSFAEIGDVKTGKIIFNRLIEKYPDSKDAALARKKLAEMEKKQPSKKKK